MTLIPGLPELFPQAFFIDLSDTGFWYRINLFDALWHRPLTDNTCLGGLSESRSNLAAIDLSFLPDDKNQRALAPFFIDNTDHRGFAYAWSRQCQVFQFQ